MVRSINVFFVDKTKKEQVGVQKVINEDINNALKIFKKEHKNCQITGWNVRFDDEVWKGGK